jgi:hypothetical protein
MVKVLNLLIPFLMEMVFGKKEDIAKLDAKSRFKRWIFLILVVLSLVINYYTIEKIATISVKYLALSKEKKVLEVKLKEKDLELSKAHSIQELLQGCIKTNYNKQAKQK